MKGAHFFTVFSHKCISPTKGLFPFLKTWGFPFLKNLRFNLTKKEKGGWCSTKYGFTWEKWRGDRESRPAFFQIFTSTKLPNVLTLIPICKIRSKSLVGHYSGKEIQITFHLVNLAFARKWLSDFIIYNNDPHYRIDRLGSLCTRYENRNYLSIYTLFIYNSWL